MSGSLALFRIKLVGICAGSRYHCSAAQPLLHRLWLQMMSPAPRFQGLTPGYFGYILYSGRKWRCIIYLCLCQWVQ